MPKIFESPDGGKTVYSREFGSKAKNFEWEDPDETRVKDRLTEQQDWRAILDAAKSNPVLQEAVDRVKILYHLSKKNGQEQIR
jgi:hypothetical protein